MSEEQLKAADAEAAKEEKEEVIEEISEDDLDGVTGGVSLGGGKLMTGGSIPSLGNLFDQRQ